MGPGLIEAIPAGARVVVDSAPVIYYLENHSLAARFAPLFDAVADGAISIAISSITVAEVLAGPLGAGKEALAGRYRAALRRWLIVPVSEDLAVTAARLRVRFRLRLPDAIQLATTVETGSYALVTHDRDFSRVRDVRVLT
jgi:predicted nucleic acid-binding protein